MIKNNLTSDSSPSLHVLDTHVNGTEEVVPFTETQMFQLFVVRPTEVELPPSVRRLLQGLAIFLRGCVLFFEETYYVDQLAAFGPPKLDVVSDTLCPIYQVTEPYLFTVIVSTQPQKVTIKLNHPKMNELYDYMLISFKSKYLPSLTLHGHPVVVTEQLTETGYREIVLQYVNA